MCNFLCNLQFSYECRHLEIELLASVVIVTPFWSSCSSCLPWPSFSLSLAPGSPQFFVAGNWSPCALICIALVLMSKDPIPEPVYTFHGDVSVQILLWVCGRVRHGFTV